MVSRYFPLVFNASITKLFTTKTKCSVIQTAHIYTASSNHCLRLRSLKLQNFVCLSTSNFCSIESSSSPEEKRKDLEQWLEHAKYHGMNIPSNISDEDFNYLIDCGHYERLKYMKYLTATQYRRSTESYRKEKLKEKKKEDKEKRDALQPKHITYGLWSNTIFGKSFLNHHNDLCNHRLASALTLKQPVIIDLSFDRDLKHRGINSLARQLKLSIIHNREDRNPLNLAFCNVDFNSDTFRMLKQLVPNVEDLPMNITSEHYLDMHPKEKIVYLSPDAKKEMTYFDPEAIYIVGGIVDLGHVLPLTLSRAKKERIQVQKLPLDRYHIFKSHKSLGVHVVVAILLDLQNTGCWRTAFYNIPRRLIRTGNEEHHTRWDRRKTAL